MFPTSELPMVSLIKRNIFVPAVSKGKLSSCFTFHRYGEKKRPYVFDWRDRNLSKLLHCRTPVADENLAAVFEIVAEESVTPLEAVEQILGFKQKPELLKELVLVNGHAFSAQQVDVLIIASVAEKKPIPLALSPITNVFLLCDGYGRLCFLSVVEGTMRAWDVYADPFICESGHYPRLFYPKTRIFINNCCSLPLQPLVSS